MSQQYVRAIHEHSRNPRNFGSLKDPDITGQYFNPLCGDVMQIDLKLDAARNVENARFSGEGCRISRAFGSMLTELIIGRPLGEIDALDEETALMGLRELVPPARNSCATLALKTLRSSLERYRGSVDTPIERQAVDLAGPKLDLMGHLTDAVGNTPLVKLSAKKWDLDGVDIHAKLEWMNPSGSIKDRVVLAALLEHVRRNELLPSTTLLATPTPNMAVSLATLASAFGVKAKMVLTTGVPAHVRELVKAAGARVLLLDDPMADVEAAARRLMMTNDDHVPFFGDRESESWTAHYHTTGVEILEQTGGALTHVVAGRGSGGTIVGLSRRLKGHDPKIRMIGVRPSEAEHTIHGLTHASSDFGQEIWDPQAQDDEVVVDTAEAAEHVRLAAEREGLFLGLSGGAALAASLRVARTLGSGRIVTIFADGGPRAYFIRSQA